MYAKLGSRLVRFISAVAAALSALLCRCACPAPEQLRIIFVLASLPWNSQPLYDDCAAALPSQSAPGSPACSLDTQFTFSVPSREPTSPVHVSIYICISASSVQPISVRLPIIYPSCSCSSLRASLSCPAYSTMPPPPLPLSALSCLRARSCRVLHWASICDSSLGP